MRRCVLAFFLSSVLFCVGCGDDDVRMECYPETYMCGGEGGNLLMYCDSGSERWELLRDCEERDQICVNGKCVTPEADGDGETDGDDTADGDGDDEPDGDETPTACDSDADCGEEFICAAGFCEDGRGVRYDIAVDGSRLIYRNDTGRLDIFDEGGAWLLRNGVTAAWLDGTGEDGVRLASDKNRTRTVQTLQEGDNLGTADRIRVTVEGGEGEPDLIWQISGYPDEGFYTFRVTVSNLLETDLRLAKTAPIVADGESGGGVYIGADPARHRILENGSFTLFDHYVEVRPGDVEPSGGMLALLAVAGGDHKGHSVSNWNHAVTDLDGGGSWIAGGLTFETSTPVCNLSYDPAYAVDAPDGRAGFSYFAAESAYRPAPKLVPAGTPFSSELFYVHPKQANPFDGLEEYALAVKRHLDITLWQDKAEGNRVPNGWNSWSGSGSTGGYGTNIDEDLMLANLDVMADEFRDWGIDWFQIDDGYEPAYGDWWWNEERFPHGPRWLSDKIREKGLRPGLWMAVFGIDADSQTATEHPDWVADKSTIGSVVAGDDDFLDLTNPEVQAHIRELFRTFREDWNFDWLKMDFAYHALFGDNLYDPTLTREEAYRNVAKMIREEIGEETFFLTVSVMGIHYGLVDSDRVTLDNMPVWDREPDQGEEARLEQQGFKPTIRTVARRYYLHNRIWVNHPDLILFRSNTLDDTWPRVTFNESLAFCSYVGLSGGLVKMGDRLLDMQADEINAVRKLVPVYGKGARPLDLFTREFPERWHLRVDGGTDGYDEVYDLVGLFNWGLNFDMTVSPYARVADDGEDLSFDLDLRTIGLAYDKTYLAYEFWTGAFLGEVEQRLVHDVPAHSGRVIALRLKTGVPQFLGWNRHLTMGAVVLKEASWDDGTKTLTVRTDVAKPTEKAPFTFRMAFYVPEGYTFTEAAYSGAALAEHSEGQDERLLSVSFVPGETGELEFTLTFE